jgi:hypothetical protein
VPTEQHRNCRKADEDNNTSIDRPTSPLKNDFLSGSGLSHRFSLHREAVDRPVEIRTTVRTVIDRRIPSKDCSPMGPKHGLAHRAANERQPSNENRLRGQYQARKGWDRQSPGIAAESDQSADCGYHDGQQRHFSTRVFSSVRGASASAPILPFAGIWSHSMKPLNMAGAHGAWQMLATMHH